MNRREFIKYGIVFGTGIFLMGVGLNRDKMEQYAEVDGALLADFHAHHRRSVSLEDKLRTFSQGISGITTFMDTDILDGDKFHNYEDFVNLPNVREINSGLFARVDYEGKVGYIIKTQEIQGDYPRLHILAIGVKENIVGHKDPRKIVEEIHKKSGVAILNHPYVVPSNDLFRYRLIDHAEERKMLEVLDMVDEVEVNNGQCIDLFFGIQLGPLKRINMKKANRMAEGLLFIADYGGKKIIGTASSDSKHISQVRSSGIWIPQKYTASIEGVKYCIKSKDFRRQDGLVNIYSFLLGHFGK